MQVQFVTSVSALAAFLRSRIRGGKGSDGSYGRFRQICEGTENIEEHLFHVRTAGLLAVALVAAGWEGLGVQVVHAESRVVVVVLLLVVVKVVLVAAELFISFMIVSSFPPGF